MFRWLKTRWHSLKIRWQLFGLWCGSPKGQAVAAEALGKLGDARAVEPLIQALRERDGGVCAAAAKALAAIGDARAVEPLVIAMGRGISAPEARLAAAQALVELSADGALAEALEDRRSEVGVRAAAASALALGRAANAEAVRALKRTLGDENGDVRAAAANALGLLGETKWLRWVTGDDADIARLGRSGDSEATVPLCKALAAGVYHRSEAFKAMGFLGRNAAVGPIVEMLRDTEGGGRPYAATVLGRIGDARAVEPLIAALSDAETSVRRAVAQALGEIGDARAVAPLIAALSDAEIRVCRAVADALGEIGDARAVEPLIAALSDAQTRDRMAVAEALGEIGDARAVAPLIAVLANKHEEVWARAGAASALGKIGDARAIGALMKTLKARSTGAPRGVVTAAASALEHLGTEHGHIEGMGLVRQYQEEVQEEAEERREQARKEKAAKAAAGGWENCPRCAAGQQWWSKAVIGMAFADARSVIPAGRRPADFAGVCMTCRDGFCSEHAYEGCCPVCGSRLTLGWR